MVRAVVVVVVVVCASTRLPVLMRCVRALCCHAHVIVVLDVRCTSLCIPLPVPALTAPNIGGLGAWVGRRCDRG